MSIIGTIYEDVTTEVLGPIGSWQWLATFLSTTIALSGMFNHFEDLFLFEASQGTLCETGEPFNISLCLHTNGTDAARTGCAKWQVKLMGLVWVRKSWIVYCEDHMQKFAIAMVCRLGSAFGCVIFGLVADSFGRKRALVIAMVSELPLSLLLTFYDSESWFRLLIFLRSLVRYANGSIAIILICEIASNWWRAPLISLVASPQILSSLFVLPLVNYVPNTDTYTFLGCLVNVGLIAVLWWTPESPQWLIFNKKISLAERLIYLAAKKNSISLCEDFKIRPVNHRAYACLEQTTTCVEIMTTYNIKMTSLVIVLLWSMYEFLWCTLYLLVFGGSPSILLLLVTFGCLFPYGCLTFIVSQKMNSKHILMINAFVAGAFTTSIIFTRTINESWRVVFVTAALTSALICRYLILNITPRLFAINVRATLFGACIAMGQVGSMISCILSVTQEVGAEVLSAVVISITVAMGVLCLALPVTDCRELPDVIEDMDYFSELTKPLRWATQKTNRPSLEEIELRVHSFGSGPSGHREDSPPRAQRRRRQRRFHSLWRFSRYFREILRRKP